MTEEDQALTSVAAVNRLFGFIAPLVSDQEDAPARQESDTAGREEFDREQQLVCRVVHQIRTEDTGLAFQMLVAMRSFFGSGGPHRLVFTLQPTFFGALAL